MVWLDFAFGNDSFPKIEVTEFDPDETSVYILSRVPAPVKDPVAALLLQTPAVDNSISSL